MLDREPTPQELNVLDAAAGLEDNILESLLAEARAAAKAAAPKAKRLSDPAQPKAREDHWLWANPANWEQTTGVALVHAETQTLLGNFTEYRHTTVPGARRLVREDRPIQVTCTETVSGTWWLGTERVVEPRRQWHEVRPAVLDLSLADLGLFSPAVEVRAHLSFGGIARVELAQATEFARPRGTQLLHLPAGTNILPCMTFDDKLYLRRELGL